MSSTCTGPYGANCKNGVAVVIEYLESIKHKKALPVIPTNDKRLTLIKQGKTTWPDDSYDESDDEFEDDDDDDSNVRTVPDTKDSIAGFLKGKSSAELSAILAEIADNHPEVRSELEFKTRMSSPPVATLAKTISREIDKASDEPGWHNHWERSGFTPDYSRVKSRLKKPFDSGKFGDIIKLATISPTIMTDATNASCQWDYSRHA